MTLELKKRIITSIILITIALIWISINKIFFIFLTFVIGIICSIEWIKVNIKFIEEKKVLKFFLIMVLAFIHFFVILPVSLIYLRGDSSESIFFLIFVLCVCIFSDIGGYAIGKIIGGKRLTTISPNKTISGSLGSFIFSIIPIFLFNFQIDISLKNIFFCLIISLVCQLGDLFISYFHF